MSDTPKLEQDDKERDDRMSDNPKLAKEIRVTQDERGLTSIAVDGDAFPWFVTVDGITTKVGRGHMPSVTVSIAAEHMFVDHGLGRA